MKPVEPLMLTSEVAEVFRVSVNTVREWTRDGKIPSVRFSARNVRYNRTHIEALATGREQFGGQAVADLPRRERVTKGGSVWAHATKACAKE